MDCFFIKKYATLRNKNFRRALLWNFISGSGGYIQNVAVSLLITEMTGSRTLLGIYLFVSYLPIFLFSYFAGKILSHITVKCALLITESLLLMLSLILAVCGGFSYIGFVIFGTAWGTVRAFQTPLQTSLPKLTCDEKELGCAVATLSLIMSLSRALGPIASGLLCKTLGYRAAFAANALRFIPAFLTLSVTELGKVKRQKTGKKPVRLDKFMLVSVFALSCFGTAYNVIFTGIIKKLGLQNVWLSVLMACVGVGATIGACLYKRKKRFLSAAVCISACQIFLALINIPYIICAISVLYGLFDYLFFTSAMSKIQCENDTESILRAMGIYTIITTGALPCGFLILGFLIDYSGISMTLTMCALLISFSYLFYVSTHTQKRV